MYARAKYGIEYTPTEPKPETPWLGRVLFVVVLAAIALIARSIWVRTKSSGNEEAGTTPPSGHIETPNAGAASAAHAATNSPLGTVDGNLSTIHYPLSVARDRPVKVRNLLMRLDAANRAGDTEMAISTIEQLRTMAGIADLDDKLARQLGTLNIRRLFDGKSRQWVAEVTVKRGDSASRIAYEHGSTLAALAKLNNNAIDKLHIGRTLFVMNHPRFSLVISRRTRTADLSLNGKFFKRYDLTGEVAGKEGSYTTPERFRNFCTDKGVPFKPLDRAELEMLLPKGSACFIKEI